MKIAVIGAGNIGGTLGRRWAAQEHDVFFGVRDPAAAKVQALLANSAGRARAVTPTAAVDAAEVVLFAVPGRAVGGLIAELGDRLDGKIIIDATNHVGRSPMHSLDALRAAAPGGALFRAFSHLGWENLAAPVIDGVQVDLFYCGDEGVGQTAVQQLIADIGLRPVYVGGAGQADLIDALTRLWFALALQQGHGRHLAFKMLGA